MTRIAVYPGTFDPVTLGHLDIITRGARLFDRLLVAVAENTEKKTLLSVAERIRLLQACIPQHNVEVARIPGLLVDFARDRGAAVILRGLRPVADFEFEFQMAATNHQLLPEVETVFLMSGGDTTFVASRFVKEIAAHGGDVRRFVPPVVAEALETHFRRGTLP
ncbi:MAG: pantetheine-phosphate adenylyltransferase [Magnetococcus sp. WYHC-3]